MKNNDITFFLDIDGTLIKLDQKPTIQGLELLVQKLQKHNINFGLNSNRSYEDVVQTINQFSLDGPFILENGAYIIDSSGSTIVLSKQNIDIQKIIVETLELFLISNKIKGAVHVSDTTSLYTAPGAHLEGLHLFVNKNRRYSGSIHNRTNGKSNFETAKNIAKFLQKTFIENSLPLSAQPHAHGHSVTIEQNGINKGTGLAHYKNSYPTHTLIAVGDGINDVSLHGKVDYLFAVSNAVPELKEVADFVSNKTMTAGVY